MVYAVRADGRVDGGGVHATAENSSLSQRPPGIAAGAHQRRRQYGVERGI